MGENYRVKEDGLTVHRKIGELQDPVSGRVIGIQQGSGQVCREGDILSSDEVSPILVDALGDEDNPLHERVSQKLEVVSDEPALNEEARLGLPFAGYDDLSEDEILAALVNLPSAAINAVKEYEAGRDDPRASIAEYNIGFGESAVERQTGSERIVSPVQDGEGEEKATAEITTREVPEDDVVEQGEGYTGTGAPQKPYGTEKEATETGKKSAKVRRSRRSRGRQAKPTQGKPKGKGGGSLEQQNE